MPKHYGKGMKSPEKQVKAAAKKVESMGVLMPKKEQTEILMMAPTKKKKKGMK